MENTTNQNKNSETNLVTRLFHYFYKVRGRVLSTQRFFLLTYFGEIHLFVTPIIISMLTEGPYRIEKEL